jgi:hypothetical protein
MHFNDPKHEPQSFETSAIAHPKTQYHITEDPRLSMCKLLEQLRSMKYRGTTYITTFIKFAIKVQCQFPSATSN